MTTRSGKRAAILAGLLVAAPSAAVERMTGTVLGGGAPVARSNVSVFAAGAEKPRLLGQARTGADGEFDLEFTPPGSPDVSLYVVATGGKAASDRGNGDNPAIGL